ncbi:MAG: nicotinate-nucleotide adenylyltransferase [Bacteroides sp.]|nr:nicotinate-nucleotide adenylyltransferase [Bacteroides sp.]
MKIGIFSGSFNPIHIGHLALANYLCEYEGLEEVWFMVTPHNPLKQEHELMDDNLRLELVKLAIEGYPKFRASDFEFRLPRPSYTVHTFDKLKEAYPEHTFSLIIGSDNWALFPRWYQAERLLAENPILIYPRPGYPVDAASLPSHAKLASSPVFEISSTFIRRALEEGRDVRYLLHPAVYARLLK